MDLETEALRHTVFTASRTLVGRMALSETLEADLRNLKSCKPRNLLQNYKHSVAVNGIYLIGRSYKRKSNAKSIAFERNKSII